MPHTRAEMQFIDGTLRSLERIATALEGGTPARYNARIVEMAVAELIRNEEVDLERWPNTLALVREVNPGWPEEMGG